ncbi:thiopeptide-type bacteriocin biosynthesis protein [Agreia bicolorata]|uniref:thiopeptide-type bacteriocin biosynthesis protein n=1 Tax=Agreia bicolorata TaxID=110935 RepID=UPI000A033D4C|nr:thiopeptide-type bacteriocin biosynthesis protein [Agreia bicolorata]
MVDRRGSTKGTVSELVNGAYLVRVSSFTRSQVDDDVDQIIQFLIGGESDDYSLDGNRLFKAIKHASSDLAEAFKGSVENPQRRSIVLATLLAYATRAKTRATPFGLFAAVGEPNSSIAWTSEQATPTLTIRQSDYLDGWQLSRQSFPAWQSARADDWLFTNNSLTIEEGRYITPSIVLEPEGDFKPRRSSVRRSVTLDELLRHCRHGVTVELALEWFAERNPTRSHVELSRFIRECVEAQALFLVNRGRPLVSAIQSKKAVSHDPRTGGTSGLAMSSGASQSAVEQPRAVDQFASNIPTVPQAMSSRVDRVAKKVFCFTVPSTILETRIKFANAFAERYGYGVRVPLRVATDRHMGVGQIIDYKKDDRGFPDESRKVADTRDDIVLASSRSGETFISLTDEQIYAMTDPRRQRLTAHFDVLYSQAPVTKPGDPDLWFGTTPGTVTPGESAGRFWRHLSPTIFNDVASGTLSSFEEAEPVQVWFLPLRAKTLGIMDAPDVTERYISVGYETNDDRCIPLVDIELVHDGRTVRLLRSGSERPLVVRNPSMVNYAQLAPELAQTLIVLGRDVETQWHPFDWGYRTELAFLPAVVVDDIVVSRATWRTPAQLSRSGGLPPKEWAHEFSYWRDRARLPELIEVGVGDRLLTLDPYEPNNFELLRRNLADDKPAITQAPPLPDVTGWIGERAHEIVQRIHLPGRPGGAESQTREMTPFIPARPPKSWIAMELVGGPKLEPSITAAANLVKIARTFGIEDWHFVRYNLPDRHLRLRFEVKAPGDRYALMPSLESAAFALIGEVFSNVRFVAFQPELARYGGQAGFGEVKSLFTLSSDSCLAFETNAGSGETFELRLAAATASAIELLAGLIGGSEWVETAIDALRGLPRAVAMKKDRRAVTDALGRVNLAGCDTSENQMNNTRSAFATSSARSVILSVLHMHSNRFFGMSVEHEKVLMSTVDSVLRRRLALSSK